MRSNQFWIVSLAVAAFASVAAAQQLGLPAATTPALLQGVGIDQNLNAQVPLDLPFTDDNGQTVRLGQYFRDKPVVLALVYYECPGLCDRILNGISDVMHQVSLKVGTDYQVVTVSFNPQETWQLAHAKKANYIEKFQGSGAEQGWHFLTGDQASIKPLADTVGFRYKYDPVSKQYVHASGIMILTPEGKIARYFYGIAYKPLDFRLGLVDASANKIGSPVDELLLFCCQYDPTTGKYGMIITRVIQVLGTTTVLLLGGLVLIMIRRDRRSRALAGRAV